MVKKNWLGRKGLQFIESLTNKEKDMCSTLEGPFKILTNKFRPQSNVTIQLLPLLPVKQTGWGKMLKNGWVECGVSAIECNYQEIDRQLKEQFIHSLDDTDMLREIIWELTKIKENGRIMSENVLSWAKTVEAQRAQPAIMNSITEAKEFYKIKLTKTHTRIVLEDTCRQRCPQNGHANIAIAATPETIPGIWEDMQNAVKLATSEQCAEAGKPGP